MDFPIFPLRGAGPLLFGMARDEVNSVLGREPESHQFLARFHPERVSRRLKSQGEFKELGLVVRYDESDRVGCLEFERPAVVTLDGVSLFNLDFSALARELGSRDSRVEMHEHGLYALDLSLFVLRDETCRVEMIEVAPAGKFGSKKKELRSSR